MVPSPRVKKFHENREVLDKIDKSMKLEDIELYSN